MFRNLAQLVAQSLDVTLTDKGADAMSHFAELELRKVIEDAATFMRLSKRTTLLPQDINAALQARNKQVCIFLKRIIYILVL